MHSDRDLVVFPLLFFFSQYLVSVCVGDINSFHFVNCLYVCSCKLSILLSVENFGGWVLLSCEKHWTSSDDLKLNTHTHTHIFSFGFWNGAAKMLPYGFCAMGFLGLLALLFCGTWNPCQILWQAWSNGPEGIFNTQQNRQIGTAYIKTINKVKKKKKNYWYHQHTPKPNTGKRRITRKDY